MAIHQVRENIYIIRSGFSGNVTVLLSDDGVALVDSKFEGDHDGIVDLVKSVTDQPIRYVINTHLHGDHTGGNAQMQAQGADVIASLNARLIMAETQAAGLPNVTLDDYMRIYLGDMPIDLHHVGRGHTDGDIVIHLPEERIIIMGDLFALWGPYESVIHYAAGGSARDWPRSLDEALKLDFDTVIPGHSGVTDRAQIEGYRDYLIRLQDMVRAMNQAQSSREDIQAMIETEFGWGGLSMGLGLDGIITEMR
jgi:glyoxylase-like metal-dependent hydrolase (beta-lactamase superfamily II)